VRVDLSPYAVIAFVLVVVAAVAAAGLAEAARRWAHGLTRRAPLAATVGLALTFAALANVFVARTCVTAVEVRNRPILAAFSDNPCRPEAIAQVALVLVAATATTVAARIAGGRRPHPHADTLVPR
jgi:hypothetical protein